MKRKPRFECLCRARRVDHDGAEEPREFLFCEERLWTTILKVRYEGKMFKRNYGWAAAGLLLFFAAMWSSAAAVVVATDGTLLWQIGVALGSLVVAALLWLALHDSSAHGQMPVVAGRRCRFRGGGRAWISGPRRSLEQRLVVAVDPPRACLSACALRLLVDFGADEGRPRGPRPHRRVQAISVDHRARAARPDDPARPTRPRSSRNIFPMRSRSGSRTIGPTASQACSRPRRPRASRASAGIRESSSPWSNPTGFVDNVGSSLASTVSSASTAPGSSSGSGGGGSSGGGGGGGGGGGW